VNADDQHPCTSPTTRILSDVHLRLDRPERGRRLARLVDGLDPGCDELIVAGDLCDFWFASRRRPGDEARCPGQSSLRRFRDRNGRLTILVGNHDTWLAALYRDALGAEVPETAALDLVRHGLRIHLAHGHVLGAASGSGWKTVMQGNGFLRLYRAIPTPLAAGLEALLDGTNALTRAAADRALIALFHDYGRSLPGPAPDLLVMGHVHVTLDQTPGPGQGPRLVVLGDWKRQASHLRIDPTGARLVIEPDTPVPNPRRTIPTRSP
jgi:UDP-2,3-diacylglucosamine hydrolase